MTFIKRETHNQPPGPLSVNGQGGTNNLQPPASSLKPLLVFLAATVMFSGCIDTVTPITYDDPSSLGTETSQAGITLRLISPEAGASLESPGVELVFSAFTDDNAPLHVQVGRPGAMRTAIEEGAPGPDARYRVPVVLAHGRNDFRLRVSERDGARARALDFSLTYDGLAPGMTITGLYTPVDGACGSLGDMIESPTNLEQLCVVGRASTVPGRLATGLTASTNGTVQGETPIVDGGFAALVGLVPNAENTLGLTVTDSTNATGTGTLVITQDSIPPTLVVTSPEVETSTTAAQVQVAGRAEDNLELDALIIETGSLGTTHLPVAEDFAYVINLETGDNAITVVARDTAGNETRIPLHVRRDRVIHLRRPSEDQGAATVSLDRYGIEEFLTAEDQQELELVRIPLGDFMLASIEAIMDPVGHGIDTHVWGPAEWNMWELLTMTPDTADLRGTSIEELLTIAQGIGMPPPRLLADLHQIAVTDTFISQETVAAVLLEDVIGTHPNAARNDDGEIVMALSLYDALNALSPIAERFGPVGDHPGFLVGTSHSEVMEPGFSLSVRAQTNLAAFEGLDAASGTKDYIFILDGDQVLTFDFLDEDTFNVVGLVDEPTVDLDFVLYESPAYFTVGDTQNAGPAPDAASFYRGNGAVWDTSPWFSERVIARAGFADFHDLWATSSYQHEFHYDAGAIEDAAVVTWDRGWLTFDTSGGVGNPPEPTYLWDILTEVAQLRLHDDGVAEGDADARFTLRDVPVGLEARDIIETLRPSLQEQQDRLSELLFGAGGGLAPSGCDLYYVEGTGGEALLFFRSVEDTDDVYDNPHPGFYSDPGLTTLVSTVAALPGTDDSAHHKVRVQAGSLFYFQNPAGERFRLEVLDVTDGQVDILLSDAEVM